MIRNTIETDEPSIIFNSIDSLLEFRVFILRKKFLYYSLEIPNFEQNEWNVSKYDRKKLIVVCFNL